MQFKSRKKLMNSHSCVKLVNRSVKSFKEIITQLVQKDYNSTCMNIQKNIQELYEILLLNQHNGRIVEYSVSNEEGRWIEQMCCRQPYNGENSLSIVLDSVQIESTRKTEFEPILLKNIKRRLRTNLFNDKYCHSSLNKDVLDFALKCSQYLDNTHSLEFVVNEGILYFKATPHEGSGTLVIISRSDDALLLNDFKRIHNLSEMGYKITLEDDIIFH